MGFLALISPHFTVMALSMKRSIMKASARSNMKKSKTKALKKSEMKKQNVMKKPSMKRKSAVKNRVSVIAKGHLARSVVFSGRKEKTASGLKKSDLVKNKAGKVVSKKISAQAKKQYAKNGLKKWADACQKARKELGLKGFVPVGGKSAKGKALYAKVKSLLN